MAPVHLLLSSLALLLATSLAAAEPDPPPFEANTPTTLVPPGSGQPMEPLPQWLDEVRAQRRALNEHRKAMHDAQRRARDPWGAAQQDARREELQRRRQERREQIDEDRRLFRSYGPWLEPGWPISPVEPPYAQSVPTPMDDAESREQHYPPQGWDNRWYYRGW